MDDFAIGSPKATVGEILLKAGIVQIFSGATLEQIRLLEGDEADARFGRSIVDLGDVNGDGDREIAVGAQRTDIVIPPPDPFSTGRLADDAGSVLVMSVLSGDLLWRVDGTRRGDWLGDRLALGGDLNGDGVPEVIVAAPGGGPRGPGDGTDYAGGPGEVFVLSGTTGSEIHHFLGGELGDRFGAAVAGGSDLSGDTVPEVIISDGTAQGSLFVFSGSDGSMLGQVSGGPGSDGLGRSVVLFPDLGGDGVPELLVGSPDLSTEFAAAGGRVVIFSGADLSEIYHRDEPWVRGGYELGRAVAVAPDIDGDGVRDFVGGAPGANKQVTGSVFVFSGIDGMVFGRMNGLAGGDNLGRRLARIGDINGDAWEDFLIGAPGRELVYVCTTTDADADGAWDCLDNCDGLSNPGQWDADADGIGDECDTCTDVDGDGFADIITPATTCPEDNCPSVSNPDQDGTDSDSDGVPDACDNCSIIFNPAQDFTEACRPLTGRVRISHKRRLGVNTFSIAMSSRGFDQSLLDEASGNKFEVEILDEDGSSLFFSQLPAGAILRIKPGQGRFRASDSSSAIRVVTLKVGGNGKLSIRIRGVGVLTPTGVPAARIHFGSFRLGTVGKK